MGKEQSKRKVNFFELNFCLLDFCLIRGWWYVCWLQHMMWMFGRYYATTNFWMKYASSWRLWNGASRALWWCRPTSRKSSNASMTHASRHRGRRSPDTFHLPVVDRFELTKNLWKKRSCAN